MLHIWNTYNDVKRLPKVRVLTLYMYMKMKNLDNSTNIDNLQKNEIQPYSNPHPQILQCFLWLLAAFFSVHRKFHKEAGPYGWNWKLQENVNLWCNKPPWQLVNEDLKGRICLHIFCAYDYLQIQILWWHNITWNYCVNM